ncbi:uncharacterized protein SOCE26_098550 [Sorangium cellulosum]|uniref:Transposase (putative) YhgA-like domain-containing protein n=1 Tax=Sorangium cellulosum TaxID=56 RepID=A0A2L0F9Y0_SORCE|nr:uncharacterized protein SOCE26_098550 [Sorangium cellulosum]
MAASHSDLLFSARLEETSLFVYVLFEHQSRTHPLMAFRLLEYMVRIWQGHLERQPKATRLRPAPPAEQPRQRQAGEPAGAPVMAPRARRAGADHAAAGREEILGLHGHLGRRRARPVAVAVRRVVAERGPERARRRDLRLVRDRVRRVLLDRDREAHRDALARGDAAALLRLRPIAEPEPDGPRLRIVLAEVVAHRVRLLPRARPVDDLQRSRHERHARGQRIGQHHVHRVVIAAVQGLDAVLDDVAAERRRPAHVRGHLGRLAEIGAEVRDRRHPAREEIELLAARGDDRGPLLPGLELRAHVHDVDVHARHALRRALDPREVALHRHRLPERRAGAVEEVVPGVHRVAQRLGRVGLARVRGVEEDAVARVRVVALERDDAELRGEAAVGRLEARELDPLRVARRDPIEPVEQRQVARRRVRLLVEHHHPPRHEHHVVVAVPDVDDIHAAHPVRPRAALLDDRGDVGDRLVIVRLVGLPLVDHRLDRVDRGDRAVEAALVVELDLVVDAGRVARRPVQERVRHRRALGELQHRGRARHLRRDVEVRLRPAVLGRVGAPEEVRPGLDGRLAAVAERARRGPRRLRAALLPERAPDEGKVARLIDLHAQLGLGRRAGGREADQRERREARDAQLLSHRFSPVPACGL